MEEWKEVKGFPGYEVSSLGAVRSLDREHLTQNRFGSCIRKIKGCILSPEIDRHGYYKVCLGRKRYLVSRLVGLAFIPNPENKPTIDHINRDRTDNRVENLRWATFQEQVLNRTCGKTAKSGEKYIDQRTNGKYRIHIRKAGLYINQYFNTLPEAIAARDAFLQSAA